MNIIALLKVRDRWDITSKKCGLVPCKLARLENEKLVWLYVYLNNTPALYYRSFTIAFNAVKNLPHAQFPILNRVIDRSNKPSEWIPFYEKDLKRLVPFDEFLLRGKK